MKLLTRRISQLAWAILALVLAVSCASTSDSPGFTSTKEVLRGMVYNSDRLPVGEATISLLSGGKTTQTTLSDIHGRYALLEVPYGSVTLQFTKDGYEPLTWSFNYKVPSQIVYVQMSNLDELIDKAADAVQKRDWESTNSYFERIRKLDAQNRVASFLEAQMLTRQGRPDSAVEILERMAQADQPSLAVELALADLYQDKLKRVDLALGHLRKALIIQNDPDVKIRIQDLEKSLSSNPAEGNH